MLRYKTDTSFEPAARNHAETVSKTTSSVAEIQQWLGYWFDYDAIAVLHAELVSLYEQQQQQLEAAENIKSLKLKIAVAKAKHDALKAPHQMPTAWLVAKAQAWLADTTEPALLKSVRGKEYQAIISARTAVLEYRRQKERLYDAYAAAQCDLLAAYPAQPSDLE